MIFSSERTMSKPLVLFSNQLEHLYIQLRSLLFSSDCGAFTKRIIIVPHLAMKRWLSVRLAQDKNVGIFAGLEISLMNHITAKLLQKGFCKKGEGKKRTVTFQDLCFLLEVEVKKALFSYREMSIEDKKVWFPLLKHLKISGDEVFCFKKNGKKVVSLCEFLATVFSQYERYGEKMVEAWEGEEEINWQKKLWVKIFGKNGKVLPYFKELNFFYEPEREGIDLHVHVFAPNCFSRVQENFFSRLSQWVPVYYYILSPCRMFWTDLLSDRESSFIQSLWKKKGAGVLLQESLEGFLKDRNSFLANLGRFGREFFFLLEKSDMQTVDHYTYPLGLERVSQYKSLIFEKEDCRTDEEEKELSLLKFLQADVLFLRNPSFDDPVLLRSSDSSIQIHSSSSRFREVQVLYDTLVGIVYDHKGETNPILPRDILVMCPDVNDYEPYIRTIFSSRTSQLSWQISDVSFLSESVIAQGFLQLLSLVESRWSVVSIFQVFENPFFQKKHHISLDDLNQLRFWVKEVGVRWGINKEHREEILINDGCEGALLERGNATTWEWGIRQLLMGLITTCEEKAKGGKERDFLGVDVSLSQSALLSTFIHLVDSLCEDLRPLEEGIEFTLEEWEKYFLSLLDAYFFVDSAKKKSKREYENLVNKIKLLSSSGLLEGEKFSFFSVFCRLEAILKKETLEKLGSASDLEVVHFSNIKSSRGIPARVICLMGMEEEKFPRSQNTHIFNLMLGNEDVDYNPHPSDEDRYFFVEAILSARDYFVITYTEKHSCNIEGNLPSIVVTELLSYIDEAFAIEGCHFLQRFVKKHSNLPFHSSYYAQERNFRSFSKEYYISAKSYYDTCEKKVHHFVPEIFSNDEEKLVNPIFQEREFLIDLKDLSYAISNPLKTYFNKSLGIYLGGKEDGALKVEEDFSLSHLKHSALCKAALQMSVKEVLDLAEERGFFPLGAFREVAKQRLEKDVGSWKEHLKKFDFSPEEVFSLEMRENCDKEVLLPSGDLILPSLDVEFHDGIRASIVGRVENVTRKGFLVFGKDSLKDVMKVWPEYLVFSFLGEKLKNPMEKRLFLLKDGKVKDCFFDDPLPLLRQVLDYYFLCIENVSPLCSDWFEAIWKGDSQNLQKKIQESLNEGFLGSYNDYLKWMMRGEETSVSEVFLNSWQSRANIFFGDLVKNWFPRMFSSQERNRKSSYGKKI